MKRNGPLTRRQTDVLQLISEGLSTNATAAWLGIHRETVRSHVKGAIAALDAYDRAHAVAVALRKGWIS